jgi:GMP synthase (glutamine-hydrolysing)
MNETSYDLARMKPFLILQLRPNDAASDGEFDAFLKYGGLTADDVVRVRMDQGYLPDVNLDTYSAVIIGGGPWNISDAPEKKSAKQVAGEQWIADLVKEAVDRDYPLLGACYGFGAVVDQQGGVISNEANTEQVGPVTIILTEEGKVDPLMKDINPEFRAVVGHKEACQTLPEGAIWLATGEACTYQMFRLGENIYGTQFHPELDAEGIKIRIEVYRHAGYFPPEDGEKLNKLFAQETFTEPMKIMRGFVERYKKEA